MRRASRGWERPSKGTEAEKPEAHLGRCQWGREWAAEAIVLILPAVITVIVTAAL